MMARPIRPGTGTTQRMSEALQPDKQNGTLFADPIRASSPMPTASTGRTEDCSRPTPFHQFSLATREPSTEDILDWVQLGAFGRQRHQRDVRRHHEAMRQVPSGSVEQQHGVRSRRHGGCHLGQMQVYRRDVATRQHQAGGLAEPGADRTEDVGCQSAFKRDPLSASKRDPFCCGLCR